MKIVLTPDQQIAKNTITAFVLKKAITPDDYFITLSGYAGTGKTTVMNSIIQEIGFRKKIVVSAPTHKAKEVIASVTNQNAETIQGLLGLRPDINLEEFNPNKPIFAQISEERISRYELVVIDEASMLSKSIFKLIQEKALEHRVKIIFMGDKYQLPPVKEIISAVFNLPNIVNLETIVRQANSNPNLKLIELARNDVRDKTDNTYPYLQQIQADMNLNGEGFKLMSKGEYYPALLEHYFDSEYEQNPSLMKTICWTNSAVTQTNQYIRQKLINSNELVAVGDILMGYKTVAQELKAFPYAEYSVKNSVDYIVEGVEILTVFICNMDLKVYRTKFKDQIKIVNILHRESYDMFAEEYERRLDLAKSRRQWKQFYEFKNQIVLMDVIVNGYGVKLCDKDADYGYSITVHKSQGSTYKRVAVTLADIFKNRDDQERRKLMYVALSRTSKLNLAYA